MADSYGMYRWSKPEDILINIDREINAASNTDPNLGIRKYIKVLQFIKSIKTKNDALLNFKTENTLVRLHCKKILTGIKL